MQTSLWFRVRYFYSIYGFFVGRPIPTEYIVIPKCELQSFLDGN